MIIVLIRSSTITRNLGLTTLLFLSKSDYHIYKGFSQCCVKQVTNEAFVHPQAFRCINPHILEIRLTITRTEIEIHTWVLSKCANLRYFTNIFRYEVQILMIQIIYKHLFSHHTRWQPSWGTPNNRL